MSKLIVSIINFFILFWLVFALQSFMEIDFGVKYLNLCVPLLTSSISTYIIWKQQVNFNIILTYSAISWVIGFILGIIYISIFDPNEAQGIFLSILWTAPIAGLLGMIISIYKAKISYSKNNINDATKEKK